MTVGLLGRETACVKGLCVVHDFVCKLLLLCVNVIYYISVYMCTFTHNIYNLLSGLYGRP